MGISESFTLCIRKRPLTVALCDAQPPKTKWCTPASTAGRYICSLTTRLFLPCLQHGVVEAVSVRGDRHRLLFELKFL